MLALAVQSKTLFFSWGENRSKREREGEREGKKSPFQTNSSINFLLADILCYFYSSLLEPFWIGKQSAQSLQTVPKYRNGMEKCIIWAHATCKGTPSLISMTIVEAIHLHDLTFQGQTGKDTRGSVISFSAILVVNKATRRRLWFDMYLVLRRGFFGVVFLKKQTLLLCTIFSIWIASLKLQLVQGGNLWCHGGTYRFSPGEQIVVWGGRFCIRKMLQGERIKNLILSAIVLILILPLLQLHLPFFKKRLLDRW